MLFIHTAYFWKNKSASGLGVNVKRGFIQRAPESEDNLMLYKSCYAFLTRRF